MYFLLFSTILNLFLTIFIVMKIFLLKKYFSMISNQIRQRNALNTFIYDKLRTKYDNLKYKLRDLEDENDDFRRRLEDMSTASSSVEDLTFLND